MKTVLIRAEDKNQWERRTPIVPQDLRWILQETGTNAFVQRSGKRVFPEIEFEKAGAEICEDMSPGEVIFGVKEIPVEKILDNKVYVFFSHTIKGQEYNMPLLKKILESRSTLIDYERIISSDNRRIVYFGNYAGDAGALDILSLTGEHWASRGIETPLSAVRRAHQYHSLQEARNHLKQIGERIRNSGLPAEVVPLTVGILGYGNVSRGAQEVFDCLPVRRIHPEEIDVLGRGNQLDSNTLYMTIFKEEHLVETKSGSPFDLKEYYTHPELYRSRFSRYLPYFTLLVNAIYWDVRYPRFVTWDVLSDLVSGPEPAKLASIADITCDKNGSIECNVRSTDSGMPAYQVNPLTREVRDGHLGDGIIVLAVDNLPCELPRDSSVFFSNQLKSLVPDILSADYNSSLEESGLKPEVRKAVIVYKGQLTEDYQYLQDYLPD